MANIRIKQGRAAILSMVMALAAGATAAEAVPTRARQNLSAHDTAIVQNIRDRRYQRSAQQQLQKLLRPHIYNGQRITARIRKAAGPNTVLLRDERRWGEPGLCSFVTYRGKRAIVCEAM